MKNSNDKALVTKSHNLVEARYQFSIWETRIFTKMVSLIHPDDEDFRNYRLEIKDLINFFGVNDNDAYKKIKAVPESLLKKIVTIPYENEFGESRFIKTGIIARATIPEKRDGYIELSFHPDLKPYLLKLKKTFLTYDIRNVLKISSVYSIRIYELLKQFEGLGKRKFAIDNLRMILGATNKYKLYSNFKMRVILKAQKDLKKHTDISFSFKEEKKGQKVVAITFIIKNNNKSENQIIPKLAIEVPNLTVAAKKLQEWGIASSKIKDYQERYSEEYLLKRIKYVKHQGNSILNLAGYFASIVDNDNLVDHTEKEMAQKQATRQSVAQNKQLKTELKAIIEQLKKEFYEAEVKFMLEAFAQKISPAPYIQKAKKGRYSKFDKNLSDEENLKSNRLFRGAVLTAFKADYEAELNAALLDKKAKIEELEERYRTS